jgi:hypothetical protein
MKGSGVGESKLPDRRRRAPPNPVGCTSTRLRVYRLPSATHSGFFGLRPHLGLHVPWRCCPEIAADYRETASATSHECGCTAVPSIDRRSVQAQSLPIQRNRARRSGCVLRCLHLSSSGGDNARSRANASSWYMRSITRSTRAARRSAS